MHNIHASCVSWQSQGVLILGESGSGKSELCLRLITEFAAKLVADDRVELNVSHETIYAKAPNALKNMLEVRGVGILSVPAEEKSKISLVVKIIPASIAIERLPQEEYWTFNDVSVPLLTIHQNEIAAPAKIIALLRWSIAVK